MRNEDDAKDDRFQKDCDEAAETRCPECGAKLDQYADCPNYRCSWSWEDKPDVAEEIRKADEQIYDESREAGGTFVHKNSEIDDANPYGRSKAGEVTYDRYRSRVETYLERNNFEILDPRAGQKPPIIEFPSSLIDFRPTVRQMVDQTLDAEILDPEGRSAESFKDKILNIPPQEYKNEITGEWKPEDPPFGKAGSTSIEKVVDDIRKAVGEIGATGYQPDAIQIVRDPAARNCPACGTEFGISVFCPNVECLLYIEPADQIREDGSSGSSE